MLKTLALTALLVTTAHAVPASFSAMSVQVGIAAMSYNYEPLTCAYIGMVDDCYDTSIQAAEAQLELAIEDGDAEDIQYYTALLDCYAEIGVSILCEDD